MSGSPALSIARAIYRVIPFSVRDRLAHDRARRARERRSAAGYRALQGRTGLLLDIGASGSHLDGWISLDLQPDERTLLLDATEPWPFAGASAAAIRSEHMIEHVSVAGARRFLGEAFRALEPGGLLRTCTPDLEGITAAYASRSPELLAAHRASNYDAPSWAYFVNNYTYLYGHRFIYDLEALSALLVEAGFEQVERTAFGASRHALLAGTDSHDMGVLESIVLCVDAVKPAAASR